MINVSFFCKTGLIPEGKTVEALFLGGFVCKQCDLQLQNSD
ncbi:hypothetical protein [Kamptonema sp. UHCC 0994]|nr:hypothetical protein [Kamptonema sp. UHCC 0994]